MTCWLMVTGRFVGGKAFGVEERCRNEGRA